ncbi:hypothetical protein V6U78_09920 [Marinospirillum sp. MEB164]|uniref:Tautomerase enzyme n=1 Tax=Marinospirillum alkalitolerans TaxID=3123374 RepID=A0ABW8PZS9_9GAMM
MNIDSRYIQELGELILRCEDVVETESWDALAFVFDVGDGHMANSGFIYVGDKVIPASARPEFDMMALDNKILEFREAIRQACEYEFVQLLIQMTSVGNIHIDFEFNDRERWNMGPANYRAMRENLRPT